MGRKKTYTEEQLNIIREFYPDGDWDRILPSFHGKSKADIRAIARKNGIRRIQSRLKDKDITGQVYGQLKALNKEGKYKWRCLCSCGKETVVSVYTLTSGQVKSCGCLKHNTAYNAKDFTGERFGMLVAVERLPEYKNDKRVFYRCLCDCGNESIVYSGNLTSGHTKSCGKNHTKKEFELFHYDLDDKESLYYIYRHIAPNGKCYVGITKQEPERRFQNGNGYRTQKGFYRAIKKYGWESFKHEIVEEGLTEKEAYEKEDYYIRKVYKCFAPNGYNTREGGVHGRHYINPVIQYYEGKPVNFFEGIGQAAKTLKLAAATIKTYTGEDNAIEGYYFKMLPKTMPYNVDYELQGLEDKTHYRIKKIIDNRWKAATRQRNLAGKKRINQYTLDGEYITTFSCIEEAAKSLNRAKREAIYAAVNPNCVGEAAYGYMWRYDTGNHDSISPISYKHRKRIVKVDKKTGDIIGEYESIAAAARDLGFSMNKIKYACNGKDSFETFYLKYHPSQKPMIRSTSASSV